MKTIWMIGLLICCLFSSVPAHTAVWVVDDDGGPGVDFTVIQDCLYAAGTGDTCQVRDGTYVENLTWPGTSGITLAGDDPITCVVDGDSADPVIHVSPYVPDLELSIRGLGIRSGGGSWFGSGILVEPIWNMTVNIEDVEIYWNTDGGILVTDTHLTDAEVVLSVVNSRIMSNAATSTVFGGAAGILIGGISVDLNVDGCEIFLNDLAGILAAFMDTHYIQGQITNNRIYGNFGYVTTDLVGFGIFLGADFGNTLVIENNMIYKNGGDYSLTDKSMGIFLKFESATSHVLNNTVYDHVAESGEAAGIGVDISGPSYFIDVERNLIMGNRGAGGGYLLPFSGGLIFSNAGASVLGPEARVFNNIIASNGPHGIGIQEGYPYRYYLHSNTVVDSLSVGVEYLGGNLPLTASNLIVGDWDSGSGATDLVGNIPVTYSDIQDGAP